MFKQIIKTFFVISLSLSVICCDNKRSETMIEVNDTYKFLIGAYTEKETDGIGLLEFDPVNNEFFSTIISKEIKNPSFLLTTKDQKFLFSVEETAGDQGGKVKSFAFDIDQKALSLVSTVNTYGDHPCHLALDPSEKFLVASNYSGGSFSVFKNDSGILTHLQTIQHEGKSVLKSRQEKPHVHSTLFHPNGKQLLVADLGTDKINMYDFFPEEEEPIKPANPAFYKVKAGAGPRHFVFNESGSLIYLVHELTAELGVYSYENGTIHNLETLALTHPLFDGAVGAAEVRFSGDGAYTYVSNRGDANEISVYEKDLNEKLILIQRTSTKGIAPRNFNFSPDGKYLLVANQNSNEIIVFEMNPKSGLILDEVQKVVFNKPSYILPLR